MPVAYRGLSQIGNWNQSDVDQIQQGIRIYKASAEIQMSRIREEQWLPDSLGREARAGTYMEYLIFNTVLDAVSDFLDGRQLFCHPPIRFMVEGLDVIISFLPEDHREKMYSMICSYLDKLGEPRPKVHKFYNEDSILFAKKRENNGTTRVCNKKVRRYIKENKY